MEGSWGSPPGRPTARTRGRRPRGSIETLASGSLRVRVYAGTDALTGRDLYLKQTIPAGPDAWERAEAARDELARQIEQGRQPRTNASVLQLLERHLEVAQVEPRGRYTLRGYVRRHIAPFIGDCPIGSLNAEMLDSLYAELRRCRDHCDGRPADGTAAGRRGEPHVCRPLAAWTIRHIHYLLSAAYENAIRWDWIAVNPMRRARKPAPPRPDPQPPTPEEAAALVTESWRRGIGPLVWVAMTTGARRGEMCALRWRHLEARHTVPGEHDCVAARCQWWLVIRRAIGEAHDGTLWETDTKAHQRRHVALDPETVAVLVEHRQDCQRLAERLGVTLGEDNYIFASTPDGTAPTKPSLLSRRYDRCAKRLGIKTNLHRLRHYSATELIAGGVDVRTVAGRLGHYDATTTLRVYAAWVSAADQHASTVLMHRMPGRPVPPRHPPPAVEAPAPRSPHERVAAALRADWQSGALAAGTELTVKAIARTHGVSIGTSHRVMALLGQWGILRVCTGRPSLVLAPSNAQPSALVRPAPVVSAAASTERGEAAPSRLAIEARAGSAEVVARRPLTLELVHLGATVRTLRTSADPDDVEALQQLLRDAVRRAGGDLSRIGEYEMTVRLADQPEPLVTVVLAA